MPTARTAQPSPTRRSSDRTGTTRTWIVIALCTAAITVEGYDLIVFGVAMPDLLAERSWKLNASAVGTLGSLAYAGMLVGALVCGRLADRWGCRRLVLASVAWFTLFTVGCALAQAAWQFGLFRLLAGIGMGGVMPSVVALTKEYAPARRAALATTVVLAGIPVGGCIAALTAAGWLDGIGWRGLFGVGSLLSALVWAAALVRLPESRRHQPDPAGYSAGLREVVSGPHAMRTALFTLANFAILLTWYGLNTWLTQLMREMNYPLGSALRVTLVLNLGAVIGSFALAGLADRRGPRLIAAASAALAGAAVIMLSLGAAGTAIVLGSTALAGIGAQSALTLLNSWVASSYPDRVRATALGWVSGIGRVGAIVAPLLGGWILQAALGPTAVFYVFALTAALASAFLALVRTPPGG
ncbi:MFS transporter [Streptomyces sp. HO565]|uniref:MFS transporter n=1 Tax=Streptomyces sp. HO565 TaxID=2857489 RepID=UPI0034DBD817